MTYVIAEPCVDVMDQACVAVCPVDCIHFEQGVDRTLYIDPNECIDCGACEPACPTKAIFPEESLPAKWADYTALNAELSKKWPNIADKKDPLPDADAWKDKEDKRALLEGA